ncbi:sugar transferase [Lacticaseibacillus paracasei]|uniref:sugar transferase n=1 Tax=Lacticaseibacillus paracasei TaxID=1597 RepID=UPI0002981ED2|nr:sugar transferase [Lacticaseibacillus paracasei]EKQ20525.1 undecaprenyl-phosphate galactosephosphotransferase [Lacticaseibacillus casei UW4]OJF73115.1 multidrug MFS transporter [Lacticaseibacillus casei]MBB1169065.1 sugar transferase [Lacticaseibacillus paracasei]MBU6045869.1 sugar transferase [Lacticaseibacillus paracasei]MCL4970691.1 sugar transferase [Lacticaseibacillus paracasei]
METASNHRQGQAEQVDLGALTPTYLITKRCFDFTASLIGLILLSGFFLVLAVLIKLDDPHGKVFYSQTRLGKDGRHFQMWKFRSMVAGADKMVDKLLKKNDVEGAMFKIKDDPRITRVGRVIRKYSLDELPQLYNVLRGDMSLVGPRPPLPREVVKYTDYDRQRLTVVPGVTGLWQISGRNELGFAEMVALDIHYINNACISEDLKILFKTVLVVIHPTGAY